MVKVNDELMAFQTLVNKGSMRVRGGSNSGWQVKRGSGSGVGARHMCGLAVGSGAGALGSDDLRENTRIFFKPKRRNDIVFF